MFPLHHIFFVIIQVLFILEFFAACLLSSSFSFNILALSWSFSSLLACWVRSHTDFSSPSVAIVFLFCPWLLLPIYVFILLCVYFYIVFNCSNFVCQFIYYSGSVFFFFFFQNGSFKPLCQQFVIILTLIHSF